MKSIWKGTIGFGLVNIPVKLYSATEQSTLDLDMVDTRDMAHIHFKRVNEKTGKEVQWENIGKAYRLDDESILLDDEDFEEAAPEKSKIIEVNHFVDAAEIDPIYFENAYYVEPEKSGYKAYALLREALFKSEKVGLAQFVLRTTETLALLKPINDILVLIKMRFAQEIRPTGEFDLPPRSLVKPAELKMAVSLIDQYSAAFNIEKFKDEYSAALLDIIKAKAKGKRPKIKKIEVDTTTSDDLMQQLKNSLNKKKTV